MVSSPPETFSLLTGRSRKCHPCQMNRSCNEARTRLWRLSITTRLAAFIALSFLAFACGGDSGPESRDASGTEGPATQDSALITQGKQLYEQTCAACHGVDLAGTKTGPMFLSPIYAPNHHPDEAFYAAVVNGVRPHHWKFGLMPPQPSVSRQEVTAKVAYVRAEQQEAGITEDPSHP